MFSYQTRPVVHLALQLLIQNLPVLQLLLLTCLLEASSQALCRAEEGGGGRKKKVEDKSAFLIQYLFYVDYVGDRDNMLFLFSKITNKCLILRNFKWIQNPQII